MYVRKPQYLDPCLHGSLGQDGGEPGETSVAPSALHGSLEHRRICTGNASSKGMHLTGGVKGRRHQMY